jgi:hypothetical protein
MGIFYRNTPAALVEWNFEKISKLLYVTACRAELIGTLFVEIGSWVEKLFWGVFFIKKSPFAPL